MINLHDITARRQTEEALRASEASYRTLVESASDAVLVADQQTRFLDVNAACSRMFGYTREEMLAMTAVAIVAPAEVARVGPEIARLTSGDVVHSEWRCRRKDGSFFPSEVSAALLPDAATIARLARHEFLAGRTVAAVDAEPVYLRNDVATRSSRAPGK